jgi:hypothetical protein
MKRPKQLDNPGQTLSKILAKFDSADRHKLARDLHFGFALSISESYPDQLEAILGRPLTKDESFMVGVLHRIAVLQGFDTASAKKGKVVVKKAAKRSAKKAAKKTARKAARRR